MTALKLAWLLLALAGSIGPGLLIARRWRMGALERLCAAAIASQVIVYVLTGVLYLAGAPHWANTVLAVGCLACCAVARDEIRALVLARSSRRAAVALVALFAWVLLMLACVRAYGGAKWALDWLEHYQRMDFFARHLPRETVFLGHYSLTARPPLMNLLAAHYLSASAMRFDFFQVVFSFLNVIVLLPAVLLGRLFLGRMRRDPVPVVTCLLALSPFFLQNATYAWTKGYANFGVLAGLWFYVRGWQRGDDRRSAVGFVALAAGILVHYSAAPFALFLGLHFLFTAARRRSPGMGRILAVIAPAAIIMATWIGWAVAQYGWRATFGSNTTVTGAAVAQAGLLSRFSWNLLYTLLPHPVVSVPAEFAIDFFQPSRVGYVRDYVFTIVQTNLLFAIGSVAGIAVLVLFVRRVRQLGLFWVGFVATGIAAIAAHPTVDTTGVAHVCTQPLVLVGLVFLAASWGTLSGRLRTALAVGSAVDFGLGAFLQFSMENWNGRLSLAPNRVTVPDLTTDMPSSWAVQGWLGKAFYKFPFFGDHFAGELILLQVAILALAAAALAWLLASPDGNRGVLRRAAAPVAVLIAIGIWVIVTTGRPSRLFEVPDNVAVLAAITGKPDAPEPWIDAGIAALRRGQVVPAIQAWDESFALNPRAGLARYFPLTIATSYDRLPGEGAIAAEYVLRRPKSAEGWVALSAIRLKAGHRQPAIDALTEAQRLDPNNATAREGLNSLRK